MKSTLMPISHLNTTWILDSHGPGSKIWISQKRAAERLGLNLVHDVWVLVEAGALRSRWSAIRKTYLVSLEDVRYLETLG